MKLLNLTLFRSFLYCAAGCLLLWGCAGGKNPLGKLYHNVAARDNGFFLAREKMKETEAEVSKGMVYDYNKPLTILPHPTEASSATIAPMLEDIIKKASFPVQRHKTSNWVDDSYILIGKSRFYKEDYEDAVNTFKYVNTTSPELQMRQLALIWLMRTYMKQSELPDARGELEDAFAVSEFIKKQRLNKQNAALYYLTRAQYYTKLNDVPRIIENLEYAAPLVSPKNERSRVRFILAQYYQTVGKDKEAYAQYNKILKRNPPYELDFYSKLNLGQVTEMANASDRGRIEKYYKKLLKDQKNLEYQDKIYYEMAKFELKQNNYDKALANLAKSTKATKNNKTQQAYSYLLAGQIYYDNLQNYRLAQIYFDSTSRVLPPTAPEYAFVIERRDVLTEFTTQLNTIETQDSLIILAKLDSESLNARAERYIAAMEKKRLEEEAKQAELLAKGDAGTQAPNQFNFPGQNQNQNQSGPKTGGSGIWYFDNPATLGTARAEFIRKWGNRQLQDNWRRSSTEAPGPNLQNQTTDELAAADSVKEAEKVDHTIVLREAFMKDIPFKPEQMQAAEDSVQNAMFRLGNIYNQKLKEPVRAAETFENLLTRYPAFPRKPDVYYNLFLIYTQANDPKAGTYAALLKSEFPNSSFAKLVENPDYLKLTALENEKAQRLYDSAFTFFDADKYEKALAVKKRIEQKFPDNDIKDKLAYLQLLIIGRTEKPPVYKDAAQQFMAQHGGSPLVPRVEEILAAIAAFESGKLNYSAPVKTVSETGKNPEIPGNSEAPAAPTPYVANPIAPHFFVIIYPKGEKAFDKIDVKYSDYNGKFYQSDQLSTAPYILGDKNEMMVIKGFTDAKKAQQYATKQKAPQAPIGKIRGADFTTFVISSENFPLFYKANNLEEYLAFYRKNYQQ